MRTLKSVLLAMLLVAALSGCSAAQQPENQAYAISLCADHAEAGKLLIGVTVPISGGGGKDGGSSPEYGQIYATTGSFSAAMEVIQSTTPFALNLSQLQSIIVSRELAQSQDFETFVQDIMSTNHLFSSTEIIVCQGSAQKFMENEKPQISGLLSLELETSYEHYALQGYVPTSKLSDVYYQGTSIYGDPICMLAATVDESTPKSGGSGEAKQTAAASDETLGDVLPQDMPVISIGKNRYLGAALLKSKRMVGELDGEQTRWVKVLSGNLTSFSLIVDGSPMRIKIHGRPKIRVDASADAPKITVDLWIQPIPLRELPELDRITRKIEKDIQSMLDIIQPLGVDPVGFAETAAMKFLTVDDFQRYNWSERFKSAEIEINVQTRDAYRLF